MMQQFMQDLITWINSSTGTIVGVIGIVLAVVFYLKGKEKKEFSYCLRSRTLIRKKKAKFEKLSIDYGGKKIDDLCVSNLTIWNSGNKTLNASDMVTSKELTITALEDGKILDVEILKCSEETNKFSLQLLDEHTVKILFDYVDKMEGVVIQIIHTGTNNSLTIECKIKGGRTVKNFDNRIIPDFFVMNMIIMSSQRFFAVYATICMLILLCLAIFFTLRVFNIDLQEVLFSQNEVVAQSSNESQSGTGDVVLSIVFWVYCFSFFAVGVPAIKRGFMIGMPRALKKYSEFGD